MKTIIVTLLLLFLAGGSAAFAQNGKTTGTPGAASPSAAFPEAPIGHRQPRPSDLPSEKNLDNPNTPVNKEDAALDRRIKSICRGC